MPSVSKLLLSLSVAAAAAALNIVQAANIPAGPLEIHFFEPHSNVAPLATNAAITSEIHFFGQREGVTESIHFFPNFETPSLRSTAATTSSSNLESEIHFFPLSNSDLHLSGNPIDILELIHFFPVILPSNNQSLQYISSTSATAPAGALQEDIHFFGVQSETNAVEIHFFDVKASDKASFLAQYPTAEEIHFFGNRNEKTLEIHFFGLDSKNKVYFFGANKEASNMTEEIHFFSHLTSFIHFF